MKPISKTIKLTALLLCVQLQAQAETYLDVGLGVAKSDYSYAVNQACNYEYGYAYCGKTSAEPVTGYMGTVELGYTVGSYTAYYSHISIINHHDGRGLNMLGIKKRFNLF